MLNVFRAKIMMVESYNFLPKTDWDFGIDHVLHKEYKECSPYTVGSFHLGWDGHPFKGTNLIFNKSNGASLCHALKRNATER